MKIYLAARYSRREELCGYRQFIQASGHTVTSRWLNGAHQISDSGQPIGDTGEALIEGDDGSTGDQAANLRNRFALEDYYDVDACDILIAFTEPPRSNASRGGRHVELGIALGLRTKKIWIVGPRENIFCWLWQVKHFPDFPSALDLLKRMQ